MANRFVSKSRTFLKGADELFSVPAVVKFYNSVLNDIEPNSKSIALLLGCSMHKPYSKSFVHKKVIRMLESHSLDRHVQQYIIGEPLVVCPREMENIYPAAYYDFPPNKLGDEGRKIFVKRLRVFLKKTSKCFDHFVVFAPNTHKSIILEASQGIIEPRSVPYNVYQLPKLLKTLKKLV